MPNSSEVGFDAGWRIGFHADDPVARPGKPTVTLDRAGYDAEITVDADATWRAPTFTVTIDGMRQEDFDAVLGRPCPYLTVALGWRDAPPSLAGVGANVLAAATGVDIRPAVDLPVVLTGRITSVERSAGDVRYRTRFSGVDATWARLQSTRVGAAVLPERGSVVDYLAALCRLTEPIVLVTGEGKHPTLDGKIEIPARTDIANAMHSLARAAFPDGPDAKVPMLLRDGAVHVGTWSTKLTGGGEFAIDESAGLIDLAPAPYERREVQQDNPFQRRVVDAWMVTLLGRPDVKVGDQVSIAVPEMVKPGGADGLSSTVGGLGAAAVLAAPVAALATVIAAPAKRPFRVVAVTHTLGRAVGFCTRLRVETGSGPSEAGSIAHQVAEDIDTRLTTLARSRGPIDVGVVVAQSVAADEDRHAQRLDVDDGLADRPPPNVVVTAPQADPVTKLVDKPYLTPFAYGRTGLVVPHYPGTRVLQVNYGGDPRNAVVAGCVWAQDTEPASTAGDWWLSLPTGVVASGSGTAAPEPSGAVSSDLITGSGDRVVNVRGFELTIGHALMPEVGARPQDPAPEVLTIRSAKGNAAISIDAEGNVSISTQKEIRFTADKIVMTAPSGVEVNP